MLCNNLAIHYRNNHGRYQDALPLHRCGIAASPFAEHYDGILRCYIELEDRENIVKAAEDLWHYAAEQGYSRHSPGGYIKPLCWALHKLDRHSEKAIWLERIVAWQREQDEDEANLSDDALYARLVLVSYLGRDYPDLALAVYEALQPQLAGQTDALRLMYAGNSAHNLNRYAEARTLYQRSLDAYAQSGKLPDVSVAQIHKFMQNCDRELQAQAAPAPAAKKSWWKVW
jgi:tetratricopeptide (TPR) repeat protein